jgi:hypothetical protein
MAYVYQHIREDNNEVFYIGIGSDKSFKRANEFSSGRNSYWRNIKNKTNIKVKIIYKDVSWDDACEIEQLLIDMYGRKDLMKGTLVNMTDGGDGSVNIIVSKDTREKLSKAGKGRKMSQELKDKLFNLKIGIPRKEETKQKLRQYTGIKSSKSIQLINTDTGELFESIIDLASKYNIKYRVILNRLNCNKKSRDKRLFNIKVISKEEYIAELENRIKQLEK